MKKYEVKVEEQKTMYFTYMVYANSESDAKESVLDNRYMFEPKSEELGDWVDQVVYTKEIKGE